MAEEGPAQKRRRTEPGSISAEDIAHANSTLHLFTGQRQSRWMQDWVPLSTAANGEGAYTSPQKSPARAHRSPLHVAAPARAVRGGGRGAHARRLPGNNVATHEQHANERGVLQWTEPRTNGTQHESNGNAGTPSDSMTGPSSRTALPSPAASDENTGSPKVGPFTMAMPSTLARQQRPIQTEPPARLSSVEHVQPPHASVNSPHAHQARPPHPHMMNPLRATSILVPPTRRSSGNTSQHQRVVSSQGIASPTASQQHIVPAVPHATQSIREGPLSQAQMYQRFKSFHASESARLKFNPVDSGRLTLLKDAVEKYDLFYIALSQIQALRATPDLIPTAAQGVNPKAFDYLDVLLCKNEQLTPEVLTWFSTFPMPIKDLYFSFFESAKIYDPWILQVAKFLGLLPSYWNTLAQESKKRGAPPLVQEIYDKLQLPSPVFQTAAFRAISRIVMDTTIYSHPEMGIDMLEILHRRDQALFLRGYRRTPRPQAEAYTAFAKAIKLWRKHEMGLYRFQQEQRHLPENQRRPYPAFQFTPDIVEAFQPTEIPRVPVPAADTHPAQVVLQQQAMIHNAQIVAHATGIAPPGLGMSPPLNSPLHLARPQPRVALTQPPSKTSLIFPSDREQPRAQPTNPDPVRSALHQAHLRSPRFAPAEFEAGAARLYRYVVGFALFPVTLAKTPPIQELTFQVSEDGLKTIPNYVPSRSPGEPHLCNLTEESKTYRLRCAFQPPEGFHNESSWIVADNYWPDSLFLQFNGHILEPRRKLHHGRHLPIDLTPHIQAGENKITAIINRASTDTRPFPYTLAVEIVAAATHTSLITRVPTIPAERTLASIRKTLAGVKAADGDDEVAVTSSTLTLRLFDPYSASRIFATPVRGAACAHRDCFDLETFLALCKRPGGAVGGGPTAVDCWRCPLCRGDVRPQTLVVDGFLVDVRKGLAAKGLLDTRAIVVEADGSWRVKEEEEVTGVRSPSLEREERGASTASGRKVVEVIEID